MKRQETVQKFVELRAKGIGYTRIAQPSRAHRRVLTSKKSKNGPISVSFGPISPRTTLRKPGLRRPTLLANDCGHKRAQLDTTTGTPDSSGSNWRDLALPNKS